MDRAVLQRMGIAVFGEIISAASAGSSAYKELQISNEQLYQLSRMSVRELHDIAKCNVFTITVNPRALNSSIQAVLERRDDHDLIERALRLGASRGIMHKFANMSYRTYNQAINEMGISGNVGRPAELTAEQLDQTATEHYKYTQQYEVKSNKDHLRCMVHLAEFINTDIKRIYNYYYEQNSSISLGRSKHV